MFASILAFQAIDLVLAVLLAAVALRITRARGVVALGARWRLLATPFRRVVLVGFAGFLLLTFGTALAWTSLLKPSFDEWASGHPALQRAANLGLFLFLGIAFAGMAVVFPIAGLVAAWRERADDRAAAARRRVDRALAVAGIVLAAGMGWYAVLFEPNRIVVEEVDVALEGWPADRPPLRVALVADLQSALLTGRERRVPGLVAALRPDVILVAGDLVAQSFDESRALEQARHVLKRLAAPLGVWVVNGDVDEVVEGGIEQIVAGTPVTLLDNVSTVLASDPPIELLGADPRDRAALERLLAAPARAPLRIGLVHRPRHWAELARAGCQLVLAGHTHGGQVVLPGFGPPITLEVVPRAVAAGGLHRMDASTQLYVTRGVGIEGGFAPPIRVFCPPEITLLRIGPPATAPAGAAR